MWDMLLWWRKLRNPDLVREVAHLRQDTLWFLVGLTMAAYVTWHIIRIPIDGSATEVMEHGLRHWALFMVVMASFGLTWFLQRHRPHWAAACFLVTSALSFVAAVWVLKAPDSLVLLPLLMLAAIVLMQPLVGLLIGMGTMGLLVMLWATGPLAFVDPDRLVQTGIVSLLTFVVAWALGRTLVTAIEASSASYAEAWHHAQEARANRAELVHALKQLDIAYYQLQRANASLELAWKAADAAERSKSEFVTNISHELRTPLNLVVGFSEMILTSPETYQEPLPVAYRGDLHAIYRSAQHLLALTNDVIDLARVGMDRLALVHEPLHIAETIRDACAIVQAYIKTKGLALRIHVEPDLPVVHADRLRLRQVLLNLLTNAARFTEAGGITVSAKQTGAWVTIAVTDTGKGVPADQLPRIFEEYYHDGGEHAPPTERLGGIGLGLPLSKRLIELHGGHMSVESTVGVGTTFSLQLPMHAAPPTYSSQRQPLVSSSAERILVYAAPDRQFLDFLRRHLSGYQIVPEPHLAAAITVATDVRALGILASAQTNSSATHCESPVPIVWLPLPSGAHLESIRNVVTHLVKPIARADLYDAIRHVEGTVSKVLIVDDDQRFVRLLQRMLETDPQQPEHTIRVAYDGRTALGLMEADRPDLVLLDLELPELDGPGLLAAMSSVPHLSTVPAIIISAHDRVMEQFPLHGTVSVMKPDGLRPDELLRVIEGLITTLEPPRPTAMAADREQARPVAPIMSGTR